MQKPRLQDYGITEAEIDASEESKAKSETVRFTTLLTLWVAIIIAVGVKSYSVTASIGLSILFGYIGGGICGMFVMMILGLLWEGWWYVTHPQYRKVLSRHSEYKTALKEYNAPFHASHTRKPPLSTTKNTA